MGERFLKVFLDGLQGERFRYVSTGTKLPGLGDRPRFADGAADDDRNVLKLRILSNRSEKAQAVHLRHHEVEKDQIGRKGKSWSLLTMA